jgi:hypothetical protein
MAAPQYVLTRAYFAYTSDDAPGGVNTDYQIGTTNENGTINGATAIAVGTKPAYPRGWKERIVYGEFTDTTNIVYRTKVPAFLPNGSLFNGTTTSFTKGGVTFAIFGKRGEDRFNKGG